MLLQNLILVKNKITKFINAKHPLLKEEIPIEYKNYKNMLSTLMEKSKQAYQTLKQTDITLETYEQEANP